MELIYYIAQEIESASIYIYYIYIYIHIYACIAASLASHGVVARLACTKDANLICIASCHAKQVKNPV